MTDHDQRQSIPVITIDLDDVQSVSDDAIDAPACHWCSEAATCRTPDAGGTYRPSCNVHRAAGSIPGIDRPLDTIRVLDGPRDHATDAQIEALAGEAAAHGDLAQVAICQVALGWSRGDSACTDAEWAEARSLGRAGARRECARVIRDAEAQG